jgi:hypothetical protein
LFSPSPCAEPNPSPFPIFLLCLSVPRRGAPLCFPLSAPIGRPGAPGALRPPPPPVVHLPGTGASRAGLNRRRPPPLVRATPSPSTMDSLCPSSPPILPRDVGHVRATCRSLEHHHRLGPPPRRASSAVFMPHHRHGEPPSPSRCPVSGLHPGGAHPAHRAAPRPTVSRCRPQHCIGCGLGDHAPVRPPARPCIRLQGRLGHWHVGCQFGRAALTGCWPSGAVGHGPVSSPVLCPGF